MRRESSGQRHNKDDDRSIMSKQSAQVLSCKAVVCWGIGDEGKLEDIEVEPPTGSQVRVKMLFASICHSDQLLGAQGFPLPLYPRVPGHEGVGVVESVGDQVEELKEGDLVIPVMMSECSQCGNCASGKTNMCLTYPLDMSGLLPGGASRMSVRGQKLYHALSCSTWSEYAVADANYLLKVPTSVPLPHLSILACGFSTGFGAPWKEAQAEPGSSVAVIGLGAVGLGVVEGARNRGAAKIIGVDKNHRKKEKGLAFGMTDFINPSSTNKSVSDLVKDLTGGSGVDYCFECTGVPHLLNEALESTKLGVGKAISIGSSKVTTMEIGHFTLLTGRTLKGSIFGGLKTKTELPLLIDKCKNKEIQLDELLTHEVSLADINKAFQLLKQDDCVKVIIKI